MIAHRNLLRELKLLFSTLSQRGLKPIKLQCSLQPLPCLTFSRPRSGGRPHYELPSSMQTCCPLFELPLQASVPSMKWHNSLSTLFLVFLSSYCRQGPFSDIFLKRFVFAFHDMTKVSQLSALTFASKLLLTPACSKTHEFVFFAKSVLVLSSQTPPTYLHAIFSKSQLSHP